MKSKIIIETDRFCKKCGGKIVIKEHKQITQKMMDKRKWIYTQWDYCTQCHTEWFEPKYALQMVDYKNSLKELENQDNLFFGL